MIKRKSKTFALSSAVLVLMLAGCSAAPALEGTAGSEASPSPGASPAVSVSVSPSPSPSAAPSPSPSPAPEPEKPEQRKYGVYNGAADPHTVEIETDGQPQAYQLGEGVTLKGIEDGSEVFFIYKEKPIEGYASVKQLILTKVVKAKTFKLMVQSVPTEKPAALEQGKGYELYVISPLQFDPETGTISFGDPAQGDNLQASITQLPSDYDTDDLKQAARNEFKGMELAEVPKDKRPEPFRDAIVFLEGKQGSDVKQYIVKEYGGSGYLFKVNTSTSEDGGIFSDLIYASLNSVEHVPNPE
jgi:hypothetical protein